MRGTRVCLQNPLLMKIIMIMIMIIKIIIIIIMHCRQCSIPIIIVIMLIIILICGLWTVDYGLWVLRGDPPGGPPG